MKVQNIQPVVFSSKQKMMSLKMTENVQSLLHKMNAEVKKITDGDNCDTLIIKKIYLKNGISFEDERHFKNVHPFSEQMKGFSKLEMGKTFMEFDNESGEIADYRKPFLKPWYFFIKQAEKYLENMNKNFNNKDVVRKETLKLHGLTPEGEKKIHKMVMEFEKQRLEQVIKELEKCN